MIPALPFFKNNLDFFIAFISFFWSVRIVLNSSSHIQRWYIKEYRWDRMFIYLKENPLKHIFSPPFKRLRIAPKTIVMFIFSIISLGIMLTLMPVALGIRLLIVDVLTFFIVSIVVMLFQIPTKLVHRIVIWRARRKLKKFPHLHIIGITGSFGKTSTKEFLKTILSAKYSVLATEKSKNSPIGIAEVILKKLNADHEVFIVEMGAYKRGEIKEICNLVHPQIGVVTGLNEQHIELFGSIANTRKAKYELIESLPPKSLAVFNGDNQYTRLMAKQTKDKTILTYGVSKESHLKVGELTQTREGISFTLNYKGEKMSLAAPLLGKHQAYNIAAAVAVGLNMGIKQNQISRQVAAIDPSQSRLFTAGNYNGATIIDNTYNASPDSIIADLDYMSLFSGKKYLVMMPLIELGKQGSALHETLGQHIGQSIDGIFLTNKRYYKNITLGIKKSQKSIMIEVGSSKKLAKKLKSLLAPDDVVLCVGRETTSVLRQLLT